MTDAQGHCWPAIGSSHLGTLISEWIDGDEWHDSRHVDRGVREVQSIVIWRCCLGSVHASMLPASINARGMRGESAHDW